MNIGSNVIIFIIILQKKLESYSFWINILHIFYSKHVK